MKLKFLFASSIVFAISISAFGYQKPNEIRIESIHPYDIGVPGEMLELRVSGFGEGVSLLRKEDFEIRVSQDGVDHNATLRTITPVASRPFMRNGDKSKAQNSFAFYQNFLFTVPHGLHAGSAKVTLYYQDGAMSSID